MGYALLVAIQMNPTYRRANKVRALLAVIVLLCLGYLFVSPTVRDHMSTSFDRVVFWVAYLAAIGFAILHVIRFRRKIRAYDEHRNKPL
jgi:membrane protein DedA with SNARE-associated domain